jgi:hypothetical protein
VTAPHDAEACAAQLAALREECARLEVLVAPAAARGVAEAARMARYMTPLGKREAVADWLAKVERMPAAPVGGRGFPDPEMVAWCERLNALAGVCTLQSCAGHAPASPDEGAYSGNLWLWLSEEWAHRFYERGFYLSTIPGIERVRIMLSSWGQEIVDIDFAGNEHGPGFLDQSMRSIVRFFHALGVQP